MRKIILILSILVCALSCEKEEAIEYQWKITAIRNCGENMGGIKIEYMYSESAAENVRGTLERTWKQMYPDCIVTVYVEKVMK